MILKIIYTNMYKKLNLFVTGGCGFIGSNFCNYIADKVNKLVIIDKLDYICNEKNIDSILKKKNVFFIKDDLVKHNFLETFEKHNINYVIHFAAQTHVDNSYEHFKEFINDNIMATYKLFDAIHKYSKLIKTIHFSTDEIYGSSEDGVFFTELSNFNPTNPYASTKASCEMIVNTYKYTYKLPIIVTRCNNVYGKFQFFEKVIPLFIHRAINDQELTIHKDGQYIRDFIHVNDVIEGVLTIMEKGIFGEVYNIGNDNPIKIIDLANMIINKVGKGRITYIKDRAFNDFRYPLDVSKLKSLGWINKVDFNDGLDEVINWIKENHDYFNEIKGKSFNDIRGKLQFIPVPTEVVKQQLVSTNKKDVVRGIHTSPYAKHIICIKGSFIDYVIDFTTMTYNKYYISSDNLNKVYVPPNHGHMFISLEDDSTMFYQIEGIYNQENEKNYNYLCPFINLDIPFENNYILSEQDKKADFFKKVDYVLLGASGYLGSKIEDELKKQNKNYIILNTRLENTDLLKKQLEFYKPKYVISAAGISGKPSTSWCDSNKIETLNTNITYQLTLANICKTLNIHLTILVTGNVYKYDKDRLFKEDDEPNNESNYYYKCRVLLEKCLSCYDNILLLRISYPVSLDNHPKCLISKLKNRLDNIDNIKINITVIPELFKNIPMIIEKNQTGLLNFVNKGHIYLHELLKILNFENYKNNYNEDNQFGLLDTSRLESLVEKDKISHVFDAIIMNKK